MKNDEPKNLQAATHGEAPSPQLAAQRPDLVAEYQRAETATTHQRRYENLVAPRPLVSVWYLAHPVTGDKDVTLERNLERILRLVKFFNEKDIILHAPYYTILAAGINNDDADMYTRQVMAGCRILRSFDGMFLAGHKMSGGMRKEFDSFHAEGELIRPFVNLIGLDEQDIGRMDWGRDWERRYAQTR